MCRMSHVSQSHVHLARELSKVGGMDTRDVLV
jgi:hypothetical protein